MRFESVSTATADITARPAYAAILPTMPIAGFAAIIAKAGSNTTAEMPASILWVIPPLPFSGTSVHRYWHTSEIAIRTANA